jgi:hypothetical protein
MIRTQNFVRPCPPLSAFLLSHGKGYHIPNMDCCPPLSASVRTSGQAHLVRPCPPLSAFWLTINNYYIIRLSALCPPLSGQHRHGVCEPDRVEGYPPLSLYREREGGIPPHGTRPPRFGRPDTCQPFNHIEGSSDELSDRLRRASSDRDGDAVLPQSAAHVGRRPAVRTQGRHSKFRSDLGSSERRTMHQRLKIKGRRVVRLGALTWQTAGAFPAEGGGSKVEGAGDARPAFPSAAEFFLGRMVGIPWGGLLGLLAWAFRDADRASLDPQTEKTTRKQILTDRLGGVRSNAEPPWQNRHWPP